MAAVNRLARPAVARAGEVLCRQGEPGHDFFLIVSGNADVDVSGHPRPQLGPGDHFGELALLDRGPRSATVTAASDMQLLRLAELDFTAVIDEVPALAHKLLAALAGRIREAESRAGT